MIAISTLLNYAALLEIFQVSLEMGLLKLLFEIDEGFTFCQLMHE